MPRPEDIAWKFVVRLEGKKWRCPYCHKKSSGTVTRVKSHFLKQPKEGIASCTKVPEHISTLMELLQNQLHNKDDIAWKSVDRVEDSKWRCHYCSGEFFGDLTGVKGHLLGVPNEGISICREIPDHVRTLMGSLLDEVAEERSREAHGQSSMEPQSPSMPTQAEVAEEEGRETHGQSFMEQQSPSMPTQAEVADEERREANRQFPTGLGSSNTLPSAVPGSSRLSVESPENSSDWMDMLDQDFLDTIWETPQETHDSHGKSSTIAPAEDVLHSLNLHQPQCSIQSQMQMNDQRTLAGPSSCQYDQSPAVGKSNCLQDCNHHSYEPLPSCHEASGIVTSSIPLQDPSSSQSGITSHPPSPGSSTLFNSLPESRDVNDSQLCAVEVGPVLSRVSNTSPPNTVQHPNQLHPRCDKEDGNDTRLFPLPTPMNIEPSIELPHSSNSHDLQVLEAATNTTGPSSSLDMNRCSATMDLRSIYANDEMIRNLKRKVEELDDKEAFIKEQVEIESAASSVRKKPRRCVQKWLKEIERARDNFRIIGQAHAETLPPKEQVETLTREVDELIGKTLPQTLLIEERDAKGVKFLERELTGEAIHRNIELIWDHLTKNHGCKLGIYGMGGVGKTTIMMHIHNRLLNDATFDGVVFITVSKDFSIYKLQSGIEKALKCGIMEDDDEKKRAAMLSEHLERKTNCVLILDDVWEHIDLEEVGIPLRARGFKFVLTTRSFDVCRQMQCQEKIKIEPLSQEEAESLFLVELGPGMSLNLEIEAIVKSIVKECAGLPIGVIMMARSMRGVIDVFQWRDFLTKLKESSMGQIDMAKKLLMNLKVSYDRLDNPNIQQCFLSCALYPEDELIDELELIEFFIDQELIGGLNTRKEQYDRGLSMLKTLGNVCLLEDHGGKVKMHDLLRDMALHIMSVTSFVKAGKGLKRIPPEEYWTDALEKVSLMINNISEFPLNLSPNCPKLSTLLLDYGLSRDAVIPDSFFKNLRGLKVLNMSGHNMIELPNSISDLVNLRVLLLRECWKLRRVPYLGKLTSLRKLDARDSGSLEALEGLEKLVNLRYLDLTQTRIERLYKGTLNHLLNLQWLEVGVINKEDITKLEALETFRCSVENADDFNQFVRGIEQSNKPRYYNLNVGKKNSKFIVEVSDDARFGYPGPFGKSKRSYLLASFRILERRVHIQEWGHAIVSVEGECTDPFILIPRDVQEMTLTKCSGLTNLLGMGQLGCLQKLNIEEWENLGVLCGGQNEEVIDIPAPTLTPLLFPSLRVLRINGCPKLKYLFGSGSKSNLPHLREITIEGCEEMVGIIAAVTSPPPYPLPFLPSLEVISVYHCDKMKRAVEFEWMLHFPNLRTILVFMCEKMEEIIGGPPPNLPVEDISLESLNVIHCNNMRKLFPHEWLLHFRNLQTIEVIYCLGMVEMISGAGLCQEGSITTPVNNTPSPFQPSSISLPKLEKLLLDYLPLLKSICEVPINCDSMKELSVSECPELKRIHLRLRLCEKEELPHIWMDDEEKWKMLIWDNPNAQAILQPYLRKGIHAENGMPDWFGGPCPPNAIELSAKGKDLPQLYS